MNVPMIEPGPRNLITDVGGLKVGNAEDEDARTGVTVVLPDQPAVAAVDVRGGAPGTRETDALAPGGLIEHAHGFALSGGSVFGLDAASAVAIWLSARGRGLDLGPLPIPIVPGAILFDLDNGGNKDWGESPPYRDLARRACENAAADFSLGNAGAGYGATAGALKGGLGSASAIDGAGLVVGALMAVNSFGSVVMPGTDSLWAWPFEQQGEFGNPPAPRPLPGGIDLEVPETGFPGTNTVLGIVATNVALDRNEARRIAIMAHDGIARAVRPAHTPFDGDTLFVLSTGALEVATGERRPAALGRLGSLAADCVTRAIARGVTGAKTIGAHPAYGTRPKN